jgi:hypothetical protein
MVRVVPEALKVAPLSEALTAKLLVMAPVEDTVTFPDGFDTTDALFRI